MPLPTEQVLISADDPSKAHRPDALAEACGRRPFGGTAPLRGAANVHEGLPS